MKDFASQTAAMSAQSADGLERLFRLYAPWLKSRLVKRFGTDAEDILQETYLRMAPALERCAVLATPQAILLRVATNIAIDEARRRKILDKWSQCVTSSAVEGEGYGQDQVVLCKQLINSLSPKLREVFLLSRFGGLSNAAIAERLDLPLKTVEWRMSKALQHCASLMRD